MHLLLFAVCLLVAGGFAALVARRVPQFCTRLGAGSTIVGCGLGLIFVGEVLWNGSPWPATELAWSAPFGPFTVEVDALSAFFLLPVFVLPALAAVFGSEHLERYAGRKSLGETWFFFNLLVAGMVLVVIARNGLLFLVSWEVMALAGYFLIVFEHDRGEVRQAGWTYLVASHLGTAFLLPLFLLLPHEPGSLQFSLAGTSPLPGMGLNSSMANVIFLLAVVGFGTKAGFVPFHVWLPDAYAAAPAHTPAVLSGVMSKMGIYGLLRVLTLLPAPQGWWAWLLIAIGITSGLMGVLFAISQQSLRRILAYSSIENLGIIALGLGTGLLGIQSNQPAMAVLGITGALLHVLNHGLFKGLLFFGAAAVADAAQSDNTNRLGGLLKRMPGVGIPFAVGCLAISGLPPFNGFASEFLIYVAAFREELSLAGLDGLAPLVVIGALALIGGLAAACFSMSFGMAFLGEPRSEQAAVAGPPGWRMHLPLWILAIMCLLVGLFSPKIVAAMAPVVQIVTRYDAAQVAPHLDSGDDPLSAGNLLSSIVVGTTCLLALALAIAVFRKRLLVDRSVEASGTWGCGYIKPEARMQYTGSSFAHPLVDLFANILRTRSRFLPPSGLFPQRSELSTETPDVCRNAIYNAPLFHLIAAAIIWLRRLQHGRLHWYVLYLALTTVLLLVWNFGLSR